MSTSDPKQVTAWGLYNFGPALRGVFRTRREAIDEAKASAGEPWAKCRRYFQVVRVTVTPKDSP